MIRAALILPLALAACSVAPVAPVQAVNDPSPEALRALPPGVSTNAIGLQNGCYVYVADDGSIVPLTAALGQQVCT